MNRVVGTPLERHPDGRDHEILRIPTYRQPQESTECVQYALWMVCQYVANGYPDPDVRSAVDPPSLDDITECVSVGSGGWRPRQEPLTQLASTVGGVEFSLESRYNGIPQSVTEYVQPRLRNLLPSILWIDKLRMDGRARNEGPLHAVVVSGLGDDCVTFHDPLLGATRSESAERVNDAWDPEMNTAVNVALSGKVDPTTVEEL